MSNPVVLITGALTGIGRATALAFAHEGARVVVSGRRDDAGQALVTEICALGAEAEFLRADVRHEQDVQNLVDRTVARFGRLDVAVNNAGTEGTPGPVTGQTAESYAATFDTNVLGVLLSMKHELRVMQAQGSGSIVNLSSTMGQRGAPGASLYTASKHAVEGLTKSAALESAAFGVRVNAVAPGPIETAMLDRFTGSADRKAGLVAGVTLKRAGRPEEIADAIVFASSAKASFITPQIIDVTVGAPFFLVQQLLPLFGEGSSIVLLSSLAARASVGLLPAYAATKGAIDTLVKHFAALLGPRGIRVNAVAPGVIDTEMSKFARTDEGRQFTLSMQALQRIGHADDVADVVAFLASDAARWVTGDTIQVGGGSTL